MSEAEKQTTRRRMYPASPLRIRRLSLGVSLAAVAASAGLSLTRASYLERDPDSASARDLAAYEAALCGFGGCNSELAIVRAIRKLKAAL